jgi:methionyl-tRNA formyltransferase
MKEPKTIVFCGTPAFAVPSLAAVYGCKDLRIIAVVTQPDRPAGRNAVLTPPPVKTAALEYGLLVLQPEDINAELPGMLKEQPDFLVTVAYGELIKDALLTLPRIAPINVHPSLLPRWRGASPIQHTILSGDRQGGTTIQIMSPELDAGDVLAQRTAPVEDRETFTTLHDKLAKISGALLVEVLTNPLFPVAQPSEDITICRKLSREDGRADPATMTAEEIDRKVRALTPWPGVTCTIESNEVKLHETSLDPLPGSLPVPCRSNTTLYVVRLQSPGKNAVSGDEWLRGRRK